MSARGLFKRAKVTTAILCFTWAATVADSVAADNNRKGTMQLTSTAFTEGQPIPAKYTCEGKNVSPPLKWSGVPAGAKALALIADDPDAPVGTWVHWVLFDLPPGASELAEDLAKSQHVAGATQGLNDFKHLGYGGPCPPPGKPHRYFFKLYALDTTLGLKPGSTKKRKRARCSVTCALMNAKLIRANGGFAT